MKINSRAISPHCDFLLKVLHINVEEIYIYILCVINRLQNRFVSHGDKNKIFRKRSSVDPKGNNKNLKQASLLLYKTTQADRQPDRHALAVYGNGTMWTDCKTCS